MKELIIDNFAGGGGASTGIENALGRSPDLACNHSPEAVAMHQANHPDTHHECQDIWSIDPMQATKGRPVGLAWFSPDCRHFSKAKGAAKVDRRVRDLAWVVIKWAKLVRPRVIMLENVEEFKTWGPVDGNGIPVKSKKGWTFARWEGLLKAQGYDVQFRELRASDYGVPTIRKRLFMIARCDGQPIVWPKPTHGEGLKAERTAAECIDWSLPCHSIFLNKRQAKKVGVKRPLVKATMARIAAGVKRFIIDASDPFIVTDRVAPFMVPRYSEAPNQKPRASRVNRPMPTVTASNTQGQLVSAFLARHWGGMVGKDIRKPFPTITTRGTQDQIVTSHLTMLRGACKDGRDLRRPTPTITAGGGHLAEVRSFLMKYYGNPSTLGQDLREPIHTIRTKAAMGLVTVAGFDYQIVDIGMRMLTPRELFRAQGFPEDYKVEDVQYGGKPLTKTAQTRLCGNSVCPALAEVLVKANVRLVEEETLVGAA